jgi:hypothetical protein
MKTFLQFLEEISEALTVKQKAADLRSKRKNVLVKGTSNFEQPTHKVHISVTKDGKTEVIKDTIQAKDKHEALFNAQMKYHKMGYKVNDVSHKGIFKEEVEEEGCLLEEDMEIHELIEEIFVVSGDELYEDWGEPEEEDTIYYHYNSIVEEHKVKLGKPFLTPGGPKKRAVYVRNEKGNVVKVNFGDPNMRIKKNIPARRRSFRARHHCENPGPRTKARYWSCKAW